MKGIGLFVAALLLARAAPSWAHSCQGLECKQTTDPGSGTHQLPGSGSGGGPVNGTTIPGGSTGGGGLTTPSCLKTPQGCIGPTGSNNNNSGGLSQLCIDNPSLCSGLINLNGNNNNAPAAGPSADGTNANSMNVGGTVADPNGGIGHKVVTAGSGSDPSLIAGGGGPNAAADLGTPAQLASAQANGAAGAGGVPQADMFGKAVPTLGGGAPDPAAGGANLSGFAASSKLKFRLGDYAGAAQDATRLLEQDPTDVSAYLRRAEAFNHLGRFADAEKDALAALKLNPNNAQAWKNLAWAQLKQGKFKDAYDSALRAIALNPTDPESYMIAAYAAERLHDRDAMMKYLAAAAGLNPKYQAKLDLAKSGGKIYDEDDASSLGGDIDAARGKGGVPYAALGGGLGTLAAGGLLAWFLRRRRNASAVGANRAMAMPAPNGRKTAPAALGKYQLGIVIGRGGMGQVYLGMDTVLGRQVAIKRMTKTLSELGAESRALFVKEAKTVAQLHHPAIVDIYDIVDSGDDIYLVFELVRGKTVQQVLAESRKIPLARAVDILKPICDALEFAHGRSMVHRDLKPANIMVTEQGHIKLMDFGIARSLADAGARKTTVLAGAAAPSGIFDRTMHAIGTPAYMAPEAETGIISKEGDIYSLGVTLYEMLTGQIPFGSLATGLEKASAKFSPASSIVPSLPPAVDQLIAACLNPSPADRLKTPADFRSRLEAFAKA